LNVSALDEPGISDWFDVDVLYGRLDEARPAQRGPDRLRAMSQLEDPGARLEEQRRQHEEVVAAHERDLDAVLSADQALEVARHRHPTEATPKDHDTHWLPQPAAAIAWRAPRGWYVPGSVRKLTARRVHPLMAMMAIVSASSSVSENSARACS
jgi:hypothetical protein